MAPGPRRNRYTICRPWYCAGFLFPQTRPRCCRGRGDRGCVTGDHLTIDVLRYPGPVLPARAILMALGSSVLPSGSITYQTGTAYCWWPLTAPLRQPAPSPILHLLWLRTLLPNLPVRAPAADAFTEVLLTDFTAGYCQLHFLRVLLTAAPDHPGPPGPVTSPVAVLQPTWLRNSVTAPSCALRSCCPSSSSLPALRSLRLREKP